MEKGNSIQVDQVSAVLTRVLLPLVVRFINYCQKSSVFNHYIYMQELV